MNKLTNTSSLPIGCLYWAEILFYVIHCRNHFLIFIIIIINVILFEIPKIFEKNNSPKYHYFVFNGESIGISHETFSVVFTAPKSILSKEKHITFTVLVLH